MKFIIVLCDILMSIERVRDYFRQWGMDDKVQEFDVSSATVELAAAALNCKPERIAKTLAFKADGRSILIVVAGDARIDNQKYKARFKAKAKMLSPEGGGKPGWTRGRGSCPFAVNEGVEVYLDESLKRFSTVFPACGSSNSAIELTIDELEKYSKFKEWVDVCKVF